VNGEIRSFELGIEESAEAFLGEVLPDIARRFEEAWSPTPVLGYRIWATSDAGIHGVRQQWREPRLRATCAETSSITEIPHTDGRCGRLGCGVYAAKNAAQLLSEFAPALRSSFLVGLVGLTGKVVEHERGYRGAEATVIAVASVSNMRAAFVSEVSDLEPLFAYGDIDRPTETYSNRPALFGAILNYLADQERTQNPWI
jgi:hypothetical protein